MAGVTLGQTIKNAVNNLDLVANGLVNKAKDKLGVLDENIKTEADYRIAVCNMCPYGDKRAIAAGWYTPAADRTDDHCSLCGCNREWKSLAEDAVCGVHDYNKNNPNVVPLFDMWEFFRPSN